MGKIINLIIKGIFVGVANIIPGVSGGTIAVVLRIFDELIDAINGFFKDPKKHLSFLVPLIIGAGIGIVLFSKLIEYCLAAFSFQTNMFFVGLVVGSIPLIYFKAKEKEVKPVHYIAAVAAFIVVAGFSLIKEPTDTTAEINATLPFLMKVVGGSVIASSAMVIPGISGSFVMVLLGMYNIIIGAISGFIDDLGNAVLVIMDDGVMRALGGVLGSDNFKTLIAAGIGIVLGIIIISKIIAFLLDKAFSFTYFAILGLVFGSIFSIFKDPATYHSGISFSIVLVAFAAFIVGFSVAITLGHDRS